MSFFALIRYWDGKGEDCVFIKLPTYPISVSLTIEIHKFCMNLEIKRNWRSMGNCEPLGGFSGGQGTKPLENSQYLTFKTSVI